MNTVQFLGIDLFALTRLIATLVVFVVAIPMVTAQEEQAPGPAPSELRWVVGVQHSLPVLNQPCRLWLTSEGQAATPQADEVEVTFSVAWQGAKANLRDLPAEVSGEESIASVHWKPQRTGRCRISAKITQRDGEGTQQIETSAVDLFVISRKLHFNYWQVRPEQRFVTSVMDNRETTDMAIRWKRRGVKPLGWQGGQWHWTRGYGSAEKMAKLWSNLPPERVGIVIDEFGGGDEIDQQLGDALRLTRQQRPQMFLAPYCLSVSGQQMIDGYQQANLILVETYTPDWRWDGFITGRWKTAVDAGLGKKSVAVLGLGSQWIGTERELRRVFRMLRATCPEMPGVGFFPDVPLRLTKAVDTAIEDFFLRPVVAVQVQDGKFTLRNIGEMQATKVEVTFLDQARKRVSKNRIIAALKPWAEISDALPPGAVSAEIVAAPDRYTTLFYTPPLEQRAPEAEQLRAALQFRQGVLSRTVSHPLKHGKEWTVVHTDDNYVRSASIPLQTSGDKAVALSFDIRPNRCWFYGHNSVSLVGDGELTLTWSRQDHDAGIEGNQSRPQLIFTGKDKYVVRDVSTMGFREQETFHVLLTYDGYQAVRALVTDQKDAVLWDSGLLAAQGGFRWKALRFDVNPFPRSEISIGPQESEIVLRGGGGAADSPYWLESTISNLRLLVHD